MNIGVVVGICSRENWKSDFGVSLCSVIADFSMAKATEDCSAQWLRIFKKEGSNLSKMRQGLVEQSIECGATHIFFADTDQAFPPDTLRRLLYWKKPVVAANVPVKTVPSCPTARAKCEDPRGRIVYTRKDQEGLEEVWRIGTGIMLIDLSIFQNFPPKPWFPVTWKEYSKYNPEYPDDYQGEDWGFCELCEQAGIPLYIDHGLSWEVKHVGKLAYSHKMVPPAKEEESRIIIPKSGII